MIEIFKRKAWKRNKNTPGGYEPYPGARRVHVCYVDTVEEAREVCAKHNDKRTKKDDHFYEFTRA